MSCDAPGEQRGTMGWRREWDSNPRDPYEPTRVPGVRLQPLGHLSVAPYRGGAHYTQRRLKHNVCLEANVALDLGCEGPQKGRGRRAHAVHDHLPPAQVFRRPVAAVYPCGPLAVVRNGSAADALVDTSLDRVFFCGPRDEPR